MGVLQPLLSTLVAAPVAPPMGVGCKSRKLIGPGAAAAALGETAGAPLFLWNNSQQQSVTRRRSSKARSVRFRILRIGTVFGGSACASGAGGGAGGSGRRRFERQREVCAERIDVLPGLLLDVRHKRQRQPQAL